MSTGVNFCPQCGTPRKQAEARFCTNCGNKYPDETKPSEETPETSHSSKPPESQSQSTTTPYQASPSPTTGTSSTPSPQSPEFPQGTQQSQYWTKTRAQPTPYSISSATGPMFSRNELRFILGFIIVGVISHLLRYLLFFNSFPNIFELVIPIPIYSLIIFYIFFFRKQFLRSKGVFVDYKFTNFDLTTSLVFSSFFMTFISSSSETNQELSTIPDQIYLPSDNPQDLGLMQVPRDDYIDNTVFPRMYLYSAFMVLLLAIVSLIWYFNGEEPLLFRTIRLVTAYIGSYILVEVAPIFGRHNKESSSYGKYRTLLIFLLAFIVTAASLLGNSFFTALANRP